MFLFMFLEITLYINTNSNWTEFYGLFSLGFTGQKKRLKWLQKVKFETNILESTTFLDVAPQSLVYKCFISAKFYHTSWHHITEILVTTVRTSNVTYYLYFGLCSLG
jgi:hypothetical protein